MKVTTSRFGVLEVASEEMLQFVHGFLGFAHLREFFMVPVPENDFFTWLQAKEDPKVAFLLVNPFLFFPGYDFELPKRYETTLGIEKAEDVAAFAVVTIPPEGIGEMTVNLVAPVIINPKLKMGMQLVLETMTYTTKHRLFQDRDRSRSLAAGE
ncbi:MAG: flagellar assembly protein FliW [Bacillota bacterium]